MGGKGQKKKGIKEDGEGRERKRLRNLGHCGLFMHRFWHPRTDSSSLENKKRGEWVEGCWKGVDRNTKQEHNEERWRKERNKGRRKRIEGEEKMHWADRQPKGEGLDKERWRVRGRVGEGKGRKEGR